MLDEVLILLFLSIVSVAVFRRLNVPAVLGYLVVGLLAGDYAFGWIQDSHSMEQIAEIGVVFLLFMIGLEVSIPRLLAMRHIVLRIGVVQVLISSTSTILVGLWLGLSWQAAFAVGGALTMSSTAIVIKLLTEQYELREPHGNISLGVLLFQDIAVVPFLVLIPIFADPAMDSLLVPIILALAKGALAFAVIFYAGQYLIRPAVRRIAGTRSSELFTLFILFTALVAAWLTHQLGLSLAMGAFLAGMMLAETEYQHHVENEIRPFRDVLMGLFFISVGSQFDWRVFLNEPLAVMVLTSGLIIGKGGAIMIITYLAGFSRGIAIRSGILLGQGSEFGFALLAVAISSGLLARDLSQPIVASIILSMAISPLLIRHNEKFACRFAPGYAKTLKDNEIAIGEACKDLEGHVLLCGFGRTGQNLAQFFKRLSIPYVALETDTDIVTEAREAGETVFYGDASNQEILRLAGIERARVLVISFTELKPTENIARQVRSICGDIPMVVRTLDDRNLEHLLALGANEVVPDTVESSMMLARHTLSELDQDPATINEILDEARAGNYALIRAYFHGNEEIDLDQPDNYHLHSIEIHDSYYGNGRRLDAFKSLQDVRVIALRRNGVIGDDPLIDVELKPNDVLVIEGNREDIQAAEIEIMSGM
ncbi:MAG: potassium transporter KefB [Gammaproteobacteria bacterium]|nr:potassium transporter KefB [Gammaproteobacteria bacterium]